MSEEPSNLPDSADLDGGSSAPPDSLDGITEGDARDQVFPLEESNPGQTGDPSDRMAVRHAADGTDSGEILNPESHEDGTAKPDQAESDEAGDGPVEAAIGSPPLDQTVPNAMQVDTDAKPNDATKQPTGTEQLEPLFDQVDRLLAEQAEQAVANDFETVSDVAADQKQTQSAVKVEAGMPEQLEGSYFTPPEQLLNDALEPAASADDGRSSMSEDTPRESSQPQAIGANHVATSDIAADAEEAPVASASSVPTSQRTCGKLVGLARQAAPLIRFALRQLHHACALVNRPVARLSPPTRNTIGFVGLVTLCNAGIVAIGKLIFVLFST